jgi:hypothetical protein
MPSVAGHMRHSDPTERSIAREAEKLGYISALPSGSLTTFLIQAVAKVHQLRVSVAILARAIWFVFQKQAGVDHCIEDYRLVCPSLRRLVSTGGGNRW